MIHRGPKNTGKEMKKSAKHYRDLGKLAKLPFDAFYYFVRSIPYQDDPKFIDNGELVARPKYLLKAKNLDCKKKAVLIMAWCEAQFPKIKYILLGTSERDDKRLHHTFPCVKLKNKWITADATYQKYKLAMPKKLTKFEVI